MTLSEPTFEERAYELDDICRAAHGAVTSHHSEEGRQELFDAPIAKGIRKVADAAYAVQKTSSMTDAQRQCLLDAAKGVVYLDPGSSPITLPRNVIENACDFVRSFPDRFHLSQREISELSLIADTEIAQQKLVEVAEHERLSQIARDMGRRIARDMGRN